MKDKPTEAGQPASNPPMITFMTMKGGAGKTIGLMALASSLIERGKRLAIFEADENEPISEWSRHGQDKGTWCDDILIYSVRSFDDLMRASKLAAQNGADYILVDTKGGGSDLNQSLILNSQLVIVPSGLDVTEMQALFITCNYLIELTEDAEEEVPVVILLNRTPRNDSTLPVTQKLGLKALVEAGMPVLSARLPRRQVLADIASAGILRRYYTYCRNRPERRLMAPEVLKAVKDADLLTDEILEIMAPATEVIS